MQLATIAVQTSADAVSAAVHLATSQCTVWRAECTLSRCAGQSVHIKLVHGTGLGGVPFKFFITGSPGNGTDSAR